MEKASLTEVRLRLHVGAEEEQWWSRAECSASSQLTPLSQQLDVRAGQTTIVIRMKAGKHRKMSRLDFQKIQWEAVEAGDTRDEKETSCNKIFVPNHHCDLP